MYVHVNSCIYYSMGIDVILRLFEEENKLNLF